MKRSLTLLCFISILVNCVFKTFKSIQKIAIVHSHIQVFLKCAYFPTFLLQLSETKNVDHMIMSVSVKYLIFEITGDSREF